MGAETPLSICNLALARITTAPIADFDNEQSRPAANCRLLFHPARRKALIDAKPNFARTAVQLTVDSGVTPVFWTYAFTLPTNFLALITAHPTNDLNTQTPYALEHIAGKGQMLLTHSNQIYIRYIWDNTDITLASQGFRDVLSFVLARDLCPALNKSAADHELTEKAYRRQLVLCKNIEGQQAYPEKTAEGSWTRARGGVFADDSIFRED